HVREPPRGAAEERLAGGAPRLDRDRASRVARMRVVVVPLRRATGPALGGQPRLRGRRDLVVRPEHVVRVLLGLHAAQAVRGLGRVEASRVGRLLGEVEVLAPGVVVRTLPSAAAATIPAGTTEMEEGQMAVADAKGRKFDAATGIGFAVVAVVGL